MKARDTLSTDPFFRAYVTCALWCTHDISDEGDDATFEENGYQPHDVSDETLERMFVDCNAFRGLCRVQRLDFGDAELAGHDFWLTRERHGAGFWDGHHEEPLAHQLTELARSFGSFELYSCDGEVWHQ